MLRWLPSSHHRPGHMVSACGKYYYGPRKQDGGYEWAGPDHDWGEDADVTLSEADVISAANRAAQSDQHEVTHGL